MPPKRPSHENAEADAVQTQMGLSLSKEGDETGNTGQGGRDAEGAASASSDDGGGGGDGASDAG